MGQDACLGERDTKCLSRATSHNAWAPPPPHPSNLLLKKNPCKTEKSFKWSFHRQLGYLGLPDEAGERRLRELSRPIEKAAQLRVFGIQWPEKDHICILKAVKMLWINSLVIEPLMLSYWVIDSLRESHHGMLIFIGVPPLFDGWDLSNELLNGHYTSGSLRNSEKRQRQEKTWEIIIEFLWCI